MPRHHTTIDLDTLVSHDVTFPSCCIITFPFHVLYVCQEIRERRDRRREEKIEERERIPALLCSRAPNRDHRPCLSQPPSTFPVRVLHPGKMEFRATQVKLASARPVSPRTHYLRSLHAAQPRINYLNGPNQSRSQEYGELLLRASQMPHYI